MNQIFKNKWLVAQIKRNSHDLAFRNLERQAFQVFMPKIKTTNKKENKFFIKEVFVFPGYVFIGVEQNSYWTKINSTYGVSKILTFNNKPYEVPLDLIVTLKKRFEDNLNLITNEKLKRGDKIKFNNGPFTDLVANIESVDAKKRIYVLLEVMGGLRKLEINVKEEINFVKI